jgi:hypothetical protein
MLHIIIACVVVVDAVIGRLSLILPNVGEVEFILEIGYTQTLDSLSGG